MKKIFIILTILLVLPLCTATEVNAASGHEGFSEIILKGDGKLLAEMTDEEIEGGYKVMGKRKFWGWRHHFFLIQAEANYVGAVIFAKANRTNQPVTINYVLQEKEYTENSWKITGSISGKIQGKIKVADGTGNVGGSGEKKDTESYTRFEETKFNVILEPNQRLVFHITGGCLVTNGVSKHFIFGITSRKGSWEYVEVLTRYHELLTTEIEE